MDDIKKLLVPIGITLVGLLLIIFSIANDQNGLFLFASLVIMSGGIIGLLSVFMVLNKMARMGIAVGLLLSSLALAALDYKSIKDPIDFQNEKDRRYGYVVQRLKDIRHAQLTYKSERDTFAGNFDDLMDFVTNDSVVVIKAIGSRPDSIATDEEALKLGIISRDTSYVWAQEAIYNDDYLSDREKKYSLAIDSLRYVPFSEGTEFDIQAGFLNRNSLLVPVFLIADAAPYDREDVLQVGSMQDPTTSGNWGE